MQDEAKLYFKLAANRLATHAKAPEQLNLGESFSETDKHDITYFLLEILKEQVPHEDTNSSAR